MKVLVDTHVLLWFQAGDSALPKEAERMIRSMENEAYVSMVSMWEIGLKRVSGNCPCACRSWIPGHSGRPSGTGLRSDSDFQSSAPATATRTSAGNVPALAMACISSSGSGPFGAPPADI